MTLYSFAHMIDLDPQMCRRLIPLVGPWYCLHILQEQGMDRTQAKTTLGKVIAGLSQEQRLVLILYYVEELTMRETARVLDHTEQETYSILDDALLELIRGITPV